MKFWCSTVNHFGSEARLFTHSMRDDLEHKPEGATGMIIALIVFHGRSTGELLGQSDANLAARVD